MMRFLRAMFGCSRRVAAYDEYYKRERANREAMQLEIRAQVEQLNRDARLAKNAADRLVAGLKRDVTRW